MLGAPCQSTAQRKLPIQKSTIESYQVQSKTDEVFAFTDLNYLACQKVRVGFLCFLLPARIRAGWRRRATAGKQENPAGYLDY